MKKEILAFIVAALVCSIHSPGHASVLDPGAFGHRAEGMGGAVIALPTDLISAFYYNPAGLTRIKGINALGGIFRLRLGTQYKTQGYSKKNNINPVMPYFAFSMDTDGPATLGICLYSTMGSGYRFEGFPSGARLIDIKAVTGLLSLSPTIAYKISDRLSLGVEINIGYASSESEIPLMTSALQGYLKSDADGFGVGMTLGVLYQLTPSLSVGMGWRSPMKTSLEGNFHLDGVRGDLDLDLYWPQMFSAGIGYYVTSALTLGVSFKWSDWSYFDKSEQKYRSVLPHIPVIEDAEDTIRFQIGIEYFPFDSLALRCGYLYDPAAFEKEMISPMLPDMDINEIFGGIGFQHGRFLLDIGCNYGMLSTRRVSRSLMGYPGKYSGYRFGIGLEITSRW